MTALLIQIDLSGVVVLSTPAALCCGLLFQGQAFESCCLSQLSAYVPQCIAKCETLQLAAVDNQHEREK